MKKRYFLFLLIFAFFLFPKTINAEVLDVRPSGYSLYQGFDIFYSSESPIQLFGRNSMVFFGTYSEASITGVEYRYNNSFLKNDRGTVDVGFSIVQSNVTSMRNNLPIVYVENMACEVKVASFSNASSYGSDNVYAVRCSNIKIKSNIFRILVSTTYANGNFPLTHNQVFAYGIASGFDITYNNDVSANLGELTDETKKQTEELKKQTEATKEQTETIKDSDTSEAGDAANSFFGDFESNDYGLSDIVTMPLDFIKGMSNSTCKSLEFPVPFVNQNIELSCMSLIYKKHFSAFLSLYQVITTGLIAYWCCVNIFKLVQGFKDPEKDEIEVLDL